MLQCKTKMKWDGLGVSLQQNMKGRRERGREDKKTQGKAQIEGLIMGLFS